MSVELMGMVFRADLGGLKSRSGWSIAPSTAKLVLLALADYAAGDGTGIHPSLENLGGRTALPRRTLIEALRALEDAGLIRRIGRTPRGVIRYEIDVEALAARIPDKAPAAPGGPGRRAGAAATQEGRSNRASRGAATAPVECSNCTGGGAVTAPEECSDCTGGVQLLHPNPIHEPDHEPNTGNRHENPHGAARVRAPQGGNGMGRDPREGIRSALESFFERSKGRRFDSAWAPEHLRDLYEAFVEEAGFAPAGRAERRRWLADLERMRAAGLEPRHVEAAVRECRRRGLIIKSPASVMAAARDIAAREGQGGRPLSWQALAAATAARWQRGPLLPWDQAPEALREALARAVADLRAEGCDPDRIAPTAFRQVGEGYVLYIRGDPPRWLTRLELRIAGAGGFPVTIHATGSTPETMLETTSV
jgi:DNA-binding transcriptional ArsR family regulator